MLAGSLFHSVGPAQANAWRPKRSRVTCGTSRSSPPAEHRPRPGAAVRQGTLVCLRRVPCAQGRVSYTQSFS